MQQEEKKKSEMIDVELLYFNFQSQSHCFDADGAVSHMKPAEMYFGYRFSRCGFKEKTPLIKLKAR